MFRKRNNENSNTVPMLTYWTRQYVLVLLCSLLILAVVSGVWLRVNAYEQLYNLLELRAEQLAEAYGQAAEKNTAAGRAELFEQKRSRFADRPDVVYAADCHGNIEIIKKERLSPGDSPFLYEISPSHQSIMGEGKKIHEQVRVGAQTWLRVGVPVYQNGSITKALYVSIPARGVLLQVQRLYGSLALLTCVITLAGWFVLYFLSRRLTRPLLAVAAAARSIAEGRYDPALPQQVKERELQQLVGSFRNMAAQLKQMEQLRTDLLAGVSHELRTPITSIRGMIQAVQNKVVTGREAEEFLQISLSEAKRLQQMVEELLDFSSFEAGATPIRKEDVDLSCLTGEVIRQLSISPEFSHVQFEQDLPPGPVWVKGDAGRLRQILINLFNNSQRASATSIKIILRSGEGRAVLDIVDNGKGIAPKDQPYVFERFYRGTAGKSKKHGLGLGLTISRLLARAHGGELILLGTSAEGTTFRLHLPQLAKT
ncbi:MAG: HAMP domain-containing histidine kinase [Peptococcaceae bacterium]|nr:HAMP domain-containing histidine kinase [Peptococcaceae bacterium]